MTQDALEGNKRFFIAWCISAPTALSPQASASEWEELAHVPHPPEADEDQEPGSGLALLSHLMANTP